MNEQRTHLDELEMIRKLLILGLIKFGLTQDEVGAALGMHRTTIARMFPKGLLADVGKKS
jgi:hypothetical protein